MADFQQFSPPPVPSRHRDAAAHLPVSCTPLVEELLASDTPFYSRCPSMMAGKTRRHHSHASTHKGISDVIDNRDTGHHALTVVVMPDLSSVHSSKWVKEVSDGQCLSVAVVHITTVATLDDDLCSCYSTVCGIDNTTPYTARFSQFAVGDDA